LISNGSFGTNGCELSSDRALFVSPASATIGCTMGGGGGQTLFSDPILLFADVKIQLMAMIVNTYLCWAFVSDQNLMC
ncbi:MAG: hypothetical protein ACKPKO_04810, partial [Candidatus Fonsibacter sp.]